MDTKGQVRTGSERREMLPGEFYRSGVGAARFAAMMGIHYQTFWGRLRLRRRGAAGKPAK